MPDVPLVVLTATIWIYWFCVVAMVVRLRRRKRGEVGFVPEQRAERFMWLVWVPLVVLWMYLPWAAIGRTEGPLALPAVALADAVYGPVRWVAAAAAVACLLATIRCWRRMGDDWRMDVGARKTPLITDGMFRAIRHPIYAFSMLLMVFSAVIVPTPPMIAIAAIHLVLMNVKARNEERHLIAVHGEAYRRYLARTGRFFPRASTREG
jgi:protein-S-isoprenylcysteine O-methyltransferase Ste14